MRKVHNHNKKNSKKSKNKIKSKSKSKDQYLEFDQSFLDALIELKNMQSHHKKNYKGPDRKTVSVYIPQPNIKRPKSSFEKHFQSTRLNNINPLKINIYKAVTEQDDISFTQITPRIDRQQQNKQKTQKQSIYNIYQHAYKPNQQRSAIVIQRAWRNFQTYKVISKYNQFFRGLKYNKKPEKKNSKQQHDLQRTSKPKHKRTPAQVTSQLRQYLDSEACTIVAHNKQSYDKNIINKTKPYKDASPINMFQNRTQSEQDPKSKIIKTVSPFDQILSQKQQIKFSKHFSEKIRQLQQQQHKQKLMTMIEKIQYQLKENQLEETVEKLFKKSEEQQKQILRRELVNSPCSSQQQSEDINQQPSINFQWQTPQQKIFEARKVLLEEKRQAAINKLRKQLASSNITKQQYQNKRDVLFAKYQAQLNKIDKGKRQMQKYYEIINNQTLAFYKETVSQNKSTIRKTFSAQSIILKCIIRDITIINFQPPGIKQIQTNQVAIFQPIAVKQYIENQPIIQQAQRQQTHKATERQQDKYTSQKNLLQVFDKIIDVQSNGQNSLVDISQSGLVVIEYNEQEREKKQKIPDMIKQELLLEIVSEIFLKDKIYQRFRPYVETGVQFHRIQDFEIGIFLQEIHEYFPTKSTLKYRFNQKINPSSLQILKIIRNCDYDVEQYQLILDQQCFKRYKRFVEKKYDEKISSKLAKLKSTSEISNFKLRGKLEEKKLMKIQKIKKYTIFQRDLFVMYMKAVFNCLNQLLIQAKSFSTFMNSRSSIGPGQLTLAMKQYNKECPQQQIPSIIETCKNKIKSIVHYKVDIPTHLNSNQMQIFQSQILKQISIQLEQNEYKWVNYMDETLEIWLDLAVILQKQIINQMVNDIYIFI